MVKDSSKHPVPDTSDKPEKIAIGGISQDELALIQSVMPELVRTIIENAEDE